MNRRCLELLAALLVLLASTGAQAVITCNVASNGFATAYSPTAGGTNVTQTFFTVTCTRSSAGDPLSVSYTNKVNNGLYALGQNNRAAFGTARIRYDVYRDGSCGATWKGNSGISDTITFSGTGTVSKDSFYWGCVGAGQGVAAGTYTDLVTMTLSYGPNPQSTAVGSFNVTIGTPATCSLTTPPGNVVFNYVAFGPAVNASTTFGVTCTVALPYTMALDATSGTLVGLNYTLALSAASSTGTGAAQTHSINGTIAGGQAGTCGSGSCTASQARLLTITY